MTKTATQLAIASLFLALLVPVNTSLGQSIQLKFDLVKDIKDNLLIEPPGELEVNVNISSFDKKVAKKLRLQAKLTQAAAKDVKEIADILKKQIIATDKAVKKIKGRETNVSEAQLGRAKLEILMLNKFYLAMSTQAQQEAEFKIKRKWDEEVKKNKELKNWKLTIAWEVGLETFKLAKGVVESTATSGVMLPIEIKGILESSVSIGKNIRKLSKSEKSARQSLIKAATAVRKKLAGIELSKVERLIDNLKGLDTDLEDALFLYQRKLLKKNAYANALSESIAKSFVNEDRLRGESKKGIDEAIAKIEEMRNKKIALIDTINNEIEKGEYLEKELANLLTEARKDWKPADKQKYVEITNKINKLASDIAGLATPLDTALTLFEKAGNAAIKQLNKIK